MGVQANYRLVIQACFESARPRFVDCGRASPLAFLRRASGRTPRREGLGQTGFVEGRNIAIEYRCAEGHYDRLPQQAAELVARGVAVSLRKIPPC